MKKQILFLTFFVLAVFAGMNDVFGQAVNNTDAQAVSCVDPLNLNPLTPIAGVPYRYEADVAPALGTANWFVTTDINFITGTSVTTNTQSIGGSFISAATGLGASTVDPGPTTGVDITWKSEGLSTIDYTTGSELPLFVVVMYEAPADACANNIQAWRIDPIIAFTLDIANIDFDGANYTTVTWGQDVPQCFDLVESAKYDFGSNTVLMDYGTQTMYFEVIAANFSTSFSPYFQLSGLQTGQTADIYWGYSASAANTLIAQDIAGGSTWTMAAADAILAETTETNTSLGVSIYVRVEIQNNNFEGLNDTPITLAVDGTDSADNNDVDALCAVETAFADAATQTLELRPTINNEDPTPFIPKN